MFLRLDLSDDNTYNQCNGKERNKILSRVK